MLVCAPSNGAADVLASRIRERLDRLHARLAARLEPAAELDGGGGVPAWVAKELTAAAERRASGSMQFT